MNPDSKRRTWPSAALLLAAAAAGIPSCAATDTEKSDSQTHFGSCTEEADCGAGKTCRAGECVLASEGGPEGAGAGDAGAGDAGGAKCAGVYSVEECDATPGCTAITAPSPAAGSSRFFECQSRRACGDALTCAADHRDGVTGECVQFPSTCVPDGWTTTDCGAFGCPGEVGVADLLDCDIETVVNYVASSENAEPAEPPVDCGDLESTPSEAAWDEATTCVTEAVRSSTAFRSSWSIAGVDSLVRSAALGVTGPRGFRLYYFDYDSVGSGPNGAIAAWQTCREVVSTTPCDPGFGLCLTCNPDPDSAVHCECRRRPDGVGPSRVYCE